MRWRHDGGSDGGGTHQGVRCPDRRSPRGCAGMPEGIERKELHPFPAVKARPYALLAEVTYRCPLHCPYCSNPTRYPQGTELETEEWRRVIEEAAAIGVLQAGFSGGEPLARPDLEELVAAARGAGLYTNLLTSGVG